MPQGPKRRLSRGLAGGPRIVTPSSPRSRVLIVDDDQAIRELIALALDDTYDVQQAATAAQALQIVGDQIISAVVLDFRLPDASGLEVLDRITSARPNVPVIIMTGYGSEWVCASALKLGVWDYFPKPMNVLDLAQSVRRALSRPEAARSSAGGATERRPLPVPALWQGMTGPDMQIQKVIQLIRHRYWDHLSLGQLAQEVGMSKYQLSRRFSRAVGVPFRTYLLRVRLERGKELLASSHASMSEVAQAIGFTDLPRFDKMFKRHTGLTPSAYRSGSHAGSHGASWSQTPSGLL